MCEYYSYFRELWIKVYVIVILSHSIKNLNCKGSYSLASGSWECTNICLEDGRYCLLDLVWKDGVTSNFKVDYVFFKFSVRRMVVVVDGYEFEIFEGFEMLYIAGKK